MRNYLVAFDDFPHLLFRPGMYRPPVIDVSLEPGGSSVGSVGLECLVLSSGRGFLCPLAGDDKGAGILEPFTVT
jgi:hypothetical protein